MKRFIGFVLSLFVVLLPAVGYAKGGWAVASFGPLPDVVAGADVPVSFQLLQHGVTPVDIADWPGTEIGVVVRAGGDDVFVAAEPTGKPGSYLAVVAVPDGVESISLKAEMRNGLHVDDRWIDVPVGPATSAGDGGSGNGLLPLWTVPLFVLAVVACASIALVDVRRGRTAS